VAYNLPYYDFHADHNSVNDDESEAGAKFLWLIDENVATKPTIPTKATIAMVSFAILYE